MEAPPFSNALQHFAIYITPVENFIPAGQSRWIALTTGDYWDDKPQLSPDSNILYFTSNRDGHNCFWAMRLDPRTKHPIAAPVAIQHLHYPHSAPLLFPGLELNTMELSIVRDKIVTNLDEYHSDIWMTQLVPRR
jgi:hypothetical protein